MSVDLATALDFYAKHNAALFPIPKGQKSPTGIVASWQRDFSTDPAQWAAWASSHPDCNFGVYAAGSGWIIMDTDASGDRNEAWSMRCALLTEWGMDPAALPHVQSARGGWHDYFQVPADVDPASLRQPDALKGRINIRCQGFTVAAGSYYDGTARNEASGSYILLSAAPPHPAPAALIAHCTRAPRSTLPAAPTGTLDRGDVAALLAWLVERDAFAAYEDWLAAGMALRLEFGDSGLELWQMTHNATVDGDTEFTKWNSFAADAGADAVTIKSLIDRARKMGWRGSVRKSTSALFDGVAALAAASGASLSSNSQQPGGMPMLAGQLVLSDIGAPILQEFLAGTSDVPTRPLNSDYPDLPASVSGHALYEPLRSAIARIVAMAEQPKAKLSRAVDALAVLSLVHQDVFDQVCRRIRTLGATLPDSKIKLAATSLADKVERAFVTNDAWVYGPKGEIESDNSDNVQVFLGIVSAEVRWNGWLERAEIRGFEGTYPDWNYIDDTVVAKLRTRGNRTKTRFRPGKDFFWESLLAIAQDNPHDPVLDALSTLEASWDGKPRLCVWLSRTCGVPCDPYHQAVSRNIVGGMVHRTRNPGCKHDTMPVLFGPQGTGKSTLAALLALDNDWFTDSILLGDASKELVLSLAGKMVVEISEMGMRGNANPSHVKKMLSAQFDEGRTAYARSVTRRPRRNIFIGTTNEDEPLVDPTGNRRFLPVYVPREVDLDWLRTNVGQLVGEAAALDSQGVSFDLPRSVWGDAAAHQEAARSASDAETLLADWFTATEHTQRAYVLSADVIYITALAGFRNGGTTAARGKIMKDLGFRQEKVSLNGRRAAAWVRGEYLCMADVVRQGARYMVGEKDGRPFVIARMTGTNHG